MKSPTATAAFADSAHDIRWATSPWGDLTFTSGSHLLGASAVRETSDLKINTFKVDLSGVDQAYLALFLGRNYMDIPFYYYKATYDDSYTIIDAPWLSFLGTVTGWSFDESDTSSTLSIECANNFADFKLRNGRRTNDTTQQALWPGDLGFEFTALSDTEIRWGR